ncbi:hypothetical protein D3C85_1407850 [compost metagenome]
MPHEWEHTGEAGTAMSVISPSPMKLTFKLHNNPEPFGQLIMHDDGRLEFVGDVEKSAQVFFDYLCANFRLPAKE